ncbi:MAG: hypothetical protein COX62_05780 [Deltaproteobacteria bacterium CG_4_10_14_0_2_um_filter_43_8]|nr:MAG: hypothetical protein COV43_09610 [Deltaproteobacteria bacterium CG11_big_fil_rev_8_21_14_0_20_42_23]PJA19894.1 MAG: hypothetical protein COX62_05780 [Deltaproteobacteria bacterium CG_4_10_14_0_2_um_filter_43_8]PJC64325.1 MAG: hypothetical protein CO021_04795 [Deltaproteobacteria bacterium CG_4_9_14_0_2_um_filter_42_21]
MNYSEALHYLDRLRPKEFRMELEPLREICSLCENPQRSFSTVHICGTNGKGSTAAFLTSLLMKNKYKVGLYTSPHLVSPEERIQINRECISSSDFARLTQFIQSKLSDEMYLSYFEFMTLMSFIHFKEKKVNLAVYETGLGGRLDATNVIEPLVAIITPISFDHMHHLGKTLEEIAKEKCGIIKRAVPTVTALQDEKVMRVIRRSCDDMGSPLFIASPDKVKSPLGLLGEHQKQNAACALEAAEILSDLAYTIDHKEEALLNTTWSGRLEIVQKNPCVIIDGAHNEAGAKVLSQYLKTHFSPQRVVLATSIFADKDAKGMLRHIAPCVRELHCLELVAERASSPKDLASLARLFHTKVLSYEGKPANEALKGIAANLKKDEVLVIAGSLSLVGEVRKMFKE